ncbi:uncharacterized protein YaaQ [Salsuginibacillus halophilus]|uniref:Uncharacterized protein YaaQ n=1 Tax=Salsuginibacillus halophilus TaxID=517424 RepID=A0A2P8HBQ6_9BACI|nr:cyclic-di-AMP receptor [Salsuginibacillus halophilus]PSL43659.1 uncharacterized protein YaaQ [Salsuginibacillus halophilus]
MKIVLCIVDRWYTEYIEREMKNFGYRMTELASSGTFMRKNSTTFLFGVDEKDVDQLNEDLRQACENIEEVKKVQPSSQRFVSFVIDTKN